MVILMYVMGYLLTYLQYYCDWILHHVIILETLMKPQFVSRSGLQAFLQMSNHHLLDVFMPSRCSYWNVKLHSASSVSSAL